MLRCRRLGGSSFGEDLLAGHVPPVAGPFLENVQLSVFSQIVGVTLGAVDHECMDFALVNPHQGSTTISTGVLHCGSRSLEHWRCTGDCSKGQWWWDDFECLLKHSPF
jgi:hypothetical protein